MSDPGDETDFHDVAGANVGDWAQDGDWIKIDPRYDIKLITRDDAIDAVRDETRTNDVLDAVREERGNQNIKWGVQNHEPGYWNAVLGEEFGEASEAMLNFVDLGPIAPSPKKPKMSTVEHYRQELIHVAAVAVAMIEQLDREAEAREAIIRRMPPDEQNAWRGLLS